MNYDEANHDNYNTSFSNINLKDLMIYLDEPIEKHGRKHFRLKNHDSLILTGTTFFWNSRNISGRYLKLLQELYGYEKNVANKIASNFLSAVKNKEFIPEETYEIYNFEKQSKTSEYNIGIKNNGNDLIKKFLYNKRSLDEDLVDKIIFEENIAIDMRNNLQIYITDKEGNKKGLDVISTYGKYKRNTSAGYGFNIGNKDKTLHIFESTIDLLSYISLEKKAQKKSINELLYDGYYLSLSGVRTDILKNYIDENTKEIIVCVDNDKAGDTFYQKVKELYKHLKIERKIPQYKDWNEDIIKKFPNYTNNQKMIIDTINKEDKLTKDQKDIIFNTRISAEKMEHLNCIFKEGLTSNTYHKYTKDKNFLDNISNDQFEMYLGILNCVQKGRYDLSEEDLKYLGDGYLGDRTRIMAKTKYLLYGIKHEEIEKLIDKNLTEEEVDKLLEKKEISLMKKYKIDIPKTDKEKYIPRHVEIHNKIKEKKKNICSWSKKKNEEKER